MDHKSDQPDFESSQFRRKGAGRRATDQVGGPSNADILTAIEGLRDEIRDHKSSISSIETAFILNDLGKPDYEGHRAAHKSMVAAAKTMESYKVDATKKVLMWALGLLMLFMTTGAGEHLKRFFGAVK